VVRRVVLLVLLSAAPVAAQTETTVLGAIDFFGHKGLDVEAVRAALPLREGQPFPPPQFESSGQLRSDLGARIRKAIGRAPTDVDAVCCDERRQWMIYIGLPGQSSQPVTFNPAPVGTERFRPDVVRLSDEFGEAMGEGIAAGHSAEDRSQGFALPEYPAAKAKALAMRRYAQRHEALIYRVLVSSAAAPDRALAAQLLGYAGQSDRQVAALAAAGFDADESVRNNAVRALAVLAYGRPALASRVPLAKFVALLQSDRWSDRNKGSLLLDALTISRPPAILKQLRAEALDGLVEMARWHTLSHAMSARMMLGRIAGIEEQRLIAMANAGEVDAILAALRR
jgi:hypothetical protein